MTSRKFSATDIAALYDEVQQLKEQIRKMQNDKVQNVPIRAVADLSTIVGSEGDIVIADDLGGGPGAGPGGGGIQFDTFPQDGGYLNVRATNHGPGSSFNPSIQFEDSSGEGIDLLADAYNDEIAIGQHDNYSVGIGIYSHLGLQMFNSSGGEMQIRQSSSADPLKIQTTSTGGIEILDGGGGITITAVGTGGIHISAGSSGPILIDNLPTSAPSGANKLWRDGSGFLRIT